MSRISTQVKLPGPDATAASGPGAAMELAWLTVVPVTVLAAGLVLAVVAPAATERAAMPLAVAGLLVGVPHGAVDHVLPRWADLTETALATRALVAAYLSVAILAGVALVLAPTAAVLTFLLLSALHFGTAESAFAQERRSRTTPSPWARPLRSGAHGATVVGLLLWVRPDQVDPWLRRLAPGAANIAGTLRTPGLWLVFVLVLAQVTATLLRIRAGAPAGAAGLLSSASRYEALTLAELALLVATFAVAPPLVALGLYFGGWHALRHTGRLLDLARRPGEQTWRPATRRLAVASFLPTTVALAAMAGMLLLRDRAPVVVEVAVLLALTFPHSIVVWSLDIRRRRPVQAG